MAYDIFEQKIVSGNWARENHLSNSELGSEWKKMVQKVPWLWVLGTGAAFLIIPELFKGAKRSERLKERRKIRREFVEGFPEEETTVDIRRPKIAELMAEAPESRAAAIEKEILRRKRKAA